MTNDDPRQTDSPERYSLPALLTRASSARLGVVAAAMLVIVACFAWAGGWLSTGRLDQTRMIDTFEAVNGLHPGFRRNHAKGVCLTGWFDSSGAGARLSKAVVFEPGRVPVFGRFALAGGLPMMPDRPNAVRSMALNFALPNGEIWRTGMNDIPVFAVKDARGFYDQLVAMKPDPNTGKPDPANVKAFLEAHPETVRAMAVIKAHPFSSGFADAAYNSLDAFRFINSAGVSTPVRWSMMPVDPFTPELLYPEGQNYLFDDLILRIHQSPAL